MPLLGGLMTALFMGIAEFFAKWLTRNLAATIAGIAVMVSLTGALYVAMGALVLGIAYALPLTPGVSLGIWLFIPDNGPACIAACLGADVAMAIYRQNLMYVQLAGWGRQ